MNKYISILIISLLLFSCAEQVPPSGGKKDITPPKAIKETPENYSTNFHFSRIEIKFDEFIQLNKGGGNIIISPRIDKKPKIELLGKIVRITFQEILQKNTTYIINFGSSIKDYNEGNELINYKYVFSTGKYIDSLQVSGKIENAFTKEKLKNIIVVLYKSTEDSILTKQPLYITKTNKDGNYNIENIKKGKYQIAALDDKNLNYIFDQETEKIGFMNKLLILDSSITNIDLNLFSNYNETKIIDYTNKENNHIIFNFNKAFLNLAVDISSYNNEDVFYYSLDKKQFHYYYNSKDSIDTYFYFTINNSKKDTFKIKLKEEEINNPINYNTKGSIKDDKNIFIINFNYPIDTFNTNKLKIKSNKGNISYYYNWKNNNKTLIIETLQLEDTLFVFSKDSCFKSFHSYYTKGKIDTIQNFKESFSNLTLLLSPQENIIIELYNNNNKLIKVKNVSRETRVYFNNLDQGTYYIRVYKDNNQDEIWNTGLLKTKKQAEETLLYKEIELKTNWDKEIELIY